MKKLVLVTGSGRSGTSSVAGTLSRFGFHIPEPIVQADEKNPRGYYEAAWVIKFHAKWLESIPVRTIDSRPQAAEIAMADLKPEQEDQLGSWLAEQMDARPDGDTVVVKDPRSMWVLPLWYRVAERAGVELSTLTMLRHPTQVVRSRDTAYLSQRTDEFRQQRETTNVAAWINSIFLTEGPTRGHRRTFVPYVDLLADWRAAMTRACAQLDVNPGDLTGPHAVDDFVTSELNRSADTWEGLHVPDDVRELAEATWTAVNALVEKPDDDAAQAELDRLHEDYVAMYRAATAVSADEMTAQLFVQKRRLKQARTKVERLQNRVAEQDAELQRLREETAGKGGRTGSRWRR